MQNSANVKNNVPSEKFIELEKAIIKIEGTVGVLAEKMTDIASAVGTMSDGISKLAVTDTKVESLSDDVRHLGDAVRSLSSRTDTHIHDIREKISNHHENHDDFCDINIRQVVDDFDKKLQKVENKSLMYFVWAVLVAAFLFGYNHIGIDKLNDEKKVHLKEVTVDKKEQAIQNTEVKLLLESLHKQVGEIKTDMKKANGHRYYLSKEQKELMNKKVNNEE